MKKTLAALLFLFCPFFLFAKKGYDGIKWNMSFDKIKQKENLVKSYDDRDVDNYTDYRINFNSLYKTQYETTKNILGGPAKVYYIFTDDKKLQSISYIIPVSKTKEINLAHSVKRDKYDVFKTHPQSENHTQYLRLGFVETAIDLEKGDYSMLRTFEPKGDYRGGTLLIYDYNDDTRIYIFENIIEDQTVVVYVPRAEAL